jgi:membrane associated rhomboid family serine protease
MLPLKDENPTKHFPFVTIALIAANGYVFLSAITDPAAYDVAINLHGLIPARLVQGPPTEYLTLFSAMFIHSGWGHLLGNMLYLWIFGNNVEDYLGKTRFALFYLLCGTLASLAHLAVDPYSAIPMVGASGAISGILGAYLLLYPRARVLTLIFLGFYITVIRIPAVVLLTLWIVIQTVNSLALGAGGGGVAWLAHIAGFAAGMVLIHPCKRILGKRYGG